MGSTCHICGQTFLDRISLARHQVEVHTMEKTFSCTQCDKTFKELRTLRLHLKIHNSEYPEQCTVCKKVFRTKWQLKQHVMDHGGERPYPCPECTFTCKTKQQLNEHRRKHSGEKAYSCCQCNTRFTYRNGLIKHTKLNRCPKKILTAEGETIVKKRTRVLTKDPLAQELKDSNNNQFPGCPTLEKTALDTRILDSIQRRAAAKLQLHEDKLTGAEASGCLGEAGCLTAGPASKVGCLGMAQAEDTTCLTLAASDTRCLTIGAGGESGCLTIGPAGEAGGCLGMGQAGEGSCLTIGPAGESGCLSLGLLSSFSTSSPGSGPTPTILTTSADISSWAATLPAGTKVTVTHYDASKKHGQLELIATPTHTETIIVTQQKSDKTATLSTTTTATAHHTLSGTAAAQLPLASAPLSQISAAKGHSGNNKVVIGLTPFLQTPGGHHNSNQLLLQNPAGGSSSNQLLMQRALANNSNNQLLLPHNSHLYHSQEALNLFSSIGVPNYTESFAVDPNEILHKEKFIKSEPSTPTPKGAEFRPVFHNVRVPAKEELLFKMEPMDTFHIKQEEDSSSSNNNNNKDGPVGHLVIEPTSPTTLSSHHHLLMSPVVEQEEISVNDIKKEVLSELFDCEPEYGDEESFAGTTTPPAYDESTTMHYSDDSQDDDFSSCLLQSAAAYACEGSASGGQSSNLDLSLKLEALSPMSSFDSEPVPQTPEFYVNKEDIFKAHFDMDLSQLLDDDITDFVEDRTELFRRLSCKEEDGSLQNFVQIRSLVSGLRSKIY